MQVLQSCILIISISDLLRVLCETQVFERGPSLFAVPLLPPDKRRWIIFNSNTFLFYKCFTTEVTGNVGYKDISLNH